MATKETGPSRRRLYLPFLLLLFAAIAWSAYWFIAATLTNRAIDERIAAEHDKGREWQCARRAVEGFPFHFLVRCDGLTLTAGSKFMMTLPAFRAVAMAYSPRHIIAEFDGPALFKNAGYNDVNATWTNIQVSIRHAGTPDMQISAVAGNLAANEIKGDAAAPIFSAERFEAHGRPTPGRSGEDASIDIATSGANVLIPMVANLLNQKEPGAFALDATISKSAAFGPGSPIDNAERWRLLGGTAAIGKIYLAAGKITLDGKGDLALDDARRLSGRIAGTAAGLEQLIGMSSGNLGNLLNFGKPREAEPSAPKGLPFALVLKDGRAQFGPLKFGNLPPLY